MSIQVGINNNVCLKGAKVDDNGLLNIEFTDSSSNSNAENAAATNFLDELSSTSENDMSYDVRHIVWPISINQYVTNMEDVLKEFKKIRQTLNHILLQFMTDDNIQWNPMKGIQVINPSDTAEVQRLLTNDTTLLAMYNNYRDQFIQTLKINVSKDNLAIPFRMKFIRQSKAKHYASLPKFPPFMEPMTIPQDQSKLQFTNYEIEHGLNSGNVVAQTVPEPDAEISSEQTEELNSVFGSN